MVSGGGGRCCCERGRGYRALDVHLGDGLTHGDGVALGHKRPDEGARERRGHLHVDLVGHDLNQRVIFAHVLAGLDHPFRDDALGDGLADVG